MSESRVWNPPAPARGQTSRRLPARPTSFGWGRVFLPLGTAVLLLFAWDLGVRISGSDLFPRPLEVVRGIIELVQKGLLLKYVVASLFRVTWGFGLAVLVGVPLGLVLGWFRPAFLALNPVIQVLRPISPIAWIPVAILWFGVDDTAPVFLIFLASVFPITVSAMAAVMNMQSVYLRAAQNFGLKGLPLFRRIILPATLPQIITGIRIALGVAWLVVVAAEMIAVNSGLGYLIIDARNAGKRYDLVVAGMVMIGLIGLVLDLLVRQLEKFDEVRWGYGQR
ncbi:MAG TPA: ABC transporter permease [Verrucomicrobiae bacterium]|nr:ABC transporter permease [Verrucomicrobiae bacterium]